MPGPLNFLSEECLVLPGIDERIIGGMLGIGIIMLVILDPQCYIESVHNVDTLWTDYLKNRIFAAVRRENARSGRKVTDFVDRHYIICLILH